ncbi:MAG: phytanoyl-CoA dioxygenase family protein [Kordiimonadaceae bacterium]|nr:phytanoyl-CoA dioxygenase family protein [Kordiimonadaceae bacterium]MBO6567664.1 phytanoyl-CoA dioxygenase family protein [Kordiimonadaceae bacterium]MBO6963122.1 phytanoyl-CoA dioxygenase family protein [Kordiimonadaceae bacterium]
MTNQRTSYEAFCDDGYLVANSILNMQEIAEVNRALALPIQLLCENLGLPTPVEGDRDSLHDAMVSLKKHDQTAYLNAIKISQNHHSVLGLPGKPKLIEALKKAGLDEPVVSLKPFPIMVSEELHIEGGYNLRPLHQEWPVMQGSSDGVVCWIALHDVTAEHSALHLIPGSHKKGMRAYHRTKCGTGIVPEDLPPSDPIRLEVNAGDAVIFSCFMAHGSSPIGNKFRSAVTIRFNNLAAADFIERGYPDPSRVEIDRQPENMYTPVQIVRSR